MTGRGNRGSIPGEVSEGAIQAARRSFDELIETPHPLVTPMNHLSVVQSAPSPGLVGGISLIRFSEGAGLKLIRATGECDVHLDMPHQEGQQPMRFGVSLVEKGGLFRKGFVPYGEGYALHMVPEDIAMARARFVDLVAIGREALAGGGMTFQDVPLGHAIPRYPAEAC